MATLSEPELEEFRKLQDIKVVFDVGARDNIDYIEVNPKATYHLFEPNPVLFAELKRKVGKRKRVFLNNFGLGDKEEMGNYNVKIESFGTSEALPKGSDGPFYPIQTLDGYIAEHKLRRLDFIKIDTEGYDYKVLLGGPKAIKMARYIQYEHWDNTEQFVELLKDSFDMKDIGQRNIFCTRHGITI